VLVTIPRTVVLTTDVFDEFMEENNLYSVALAEDVSDQEILDKFISARLPFRIHEDLYTFISVIHKPIAVRSSSLLEDSHYQPFAGIYSTYMIPYVENDERRMIEMLSEAIKSVYASAFFKDSKAYMTATLNVIDEEKMAIVLQEVCGERYGSHFYPTFSGVARSINFYPIEPEKPEDGIASVALGLGKYIVDGGMTLRFSPKYPKKILQLSTPEMALKETQRTFYALDLNAEKFHACLDDGANLLQFRIAQAEKDKSIRHIASTYDYDNRVLRDGINYEGKKLITFANILQHNIFPLAEILDLTMKVGQSEMNKPVEIEFAVNLSRNKNESHIFNLLQIRPIVDKKENMRVDLENADLEKALIYSESALGNGIIENIHDVLYVKPSTFDPSKSREIAEEIGRLNGQFLTDNKNFVLVGPGRWGSADPWLGIPVKWPQISAARVIVESGLENYQVDPSQGTHFFQNLTSFRVGYFTVNPHIKQGIYNVESLNERPALYESEFVRHVRFDHPLDIRIDGKKNVGMVGENNVPDEDVEI
jgi:hypothetical protein